MTRPSLESPESLSSNVLDFAQCPTTLDTRAKQNRADRSKSYHDPIEAVEVLLKAGYVAKPMKGEKCRKPRVQVKMVLRKDMLYCDRSWPSAFTWCSATSGERTMTDYHA